MADNKCLWCDLLKNQWMRVQELQFTNQYMYLQVFANPYCIYHIQFVRERIGNYFHDINVTSNNQKLVKINQPLRSERHLMYTPLIINNSIRHEIKTSSYFFNNLIKLINYAILIFNHCLFASFFIVKCYFHANLPHT